MSWTVFVPGWGWRDYDTKEEAEEALRNSGHTNGYVRKTESMASKRKHWQHLNSRLNPSKPTR